jgi:hypothetical protein
MFVATNLDAFEHLFSDSLRQMLSPNEMGGFILVLANSLQDGTLTESLRSDIAETFKLIQTNARDNSINMTDDDRGVFKALEASGIGSFATWQTAAKGRWEIIVNPIRRLRPARASSTTFDTLLQPFAQDKFHFNKPFLQPEILWEGRWQATRIRVLYNKFPFVPYHSILVPAPDQQLPQYLSADYHGLIWRLIELEQSALPGFAAGYNSLGACASVNHLHFQGFMREALLPVEHDCWQHNGGDEPYPMQCHAFDSVTECWQLIDHCHKTNQPYNLLYRPGRCYVLPRVPQGNNAVLPRVRGAGWIEQCGVFNVTSRDELDAVSAAELEDCLRSLSVPN